MTDKELLLCCKLNKAQKFHRVKVAESDRTRKLEKNSFLLEYDEILSAFMSLSLSRNISMSVKPSTLTIELWRTLQARGLHGPAYINLCEWLSVAQQIHKIGNSLRILKTI